MSFYVLQQVNKPSYERIVRDYFKFISDSNNPDKEPTTVFSPLSQKMLDELELIREVSKDLQAKKHEEVTKDKEAKEQTDKTAEENEAKEETEVKENSEIEEVNDENTEEKKE